MFEHRDSGVKPIQRGGLGDDLVDEAHCLSALCSHPCCWETEQRITKGIYRRAVRQPTKHCTPFQESLPSLNVVNASEWAGRCSEGKQLFKSTSSDSLESEGSLHSIPSFPVLPLKNSTQNFKSADPASPGIGLTLPTSQSNGIKEKAVKLNTVQISPLVDFESSWGSSSLVLWVPNPHYIPSAQKRSKSPKYTVKELILLPACPVQKVSKVKDKPRSTNKKVRFQLACSPSPCQPDTATFTYSRGASTGHPSSATHSGVSPEPEASTESRVGGKPVVFHKVQERGIKRVSKEGPAPLYKLDSMTSKEEVDWDRLRRQVYLWKKPNPPQHKDCRDTVCPTGGASVSQEDFGLCPVSKINLHLPLHSPPPVAPAVWNCVKRTWCYQQFSHPLLSQSKNLHSTASGTDTLLTVYSTSTVGRDSSMHRMLDTAGKSVTQKCIEDTVVPFNSGLYCQDSNKKHQDGVCERAVVPGQVGHSFPEESDCSPNSGLALSFISGVVESRRASSTTDRGPEPTDWQPSTPPPSLSSL